MKKQLNIRIFLAAEPKTFAQEREELKAFVESLNEEKSNVCYELVTEEVLQKEGDAGQSFYLLVGEEFPEEESAIFHKVYDRFRETGAPVMYTYFRRKKDELPTQSVKAFMTELDEEIGHFFSIYEELDSVKLGILLELARGTGMEEVFTVRDGAAFFRGREALSLENLPLYKENEGLQALQKEQKALAAQFEKAAEAAAHDPGNRTLQTEKEEISRKQKEIFDTIHKQEEELRDLLLEVAGLTGGEGRPTSAQKLAIRELENGNYENAEQILRRADRSLANSPLSAMLAADKKVLEGYVSENRLLIKTLMASGLTGERADEIRTCWEETLRLTKEYGLDPLQVKEYVGFLAQTGENSRSLEVISLLEKLYELHDVAEKERANLIIEKGITYAGLEQDLEAEKCLIRGVRLLRELAAKKGADKEIRSMLLSACYNLGVFEKDHFGKTEQALLYLKEAEEGYLELCEEDQDFWETRLSMVYQSQGSVYKNQNKAGGYKKAEECYLKAIEICERRAEESLMGMGQQLAENYLHYSDLCIRQKKLNQAYLLAEKAWRNYDKMARISPVLYREKADMARSRMVDTGLFEMQSIKKDLKTHLEEIEKLNKKAAKPHIKRKEKKFFLEKAMKHCAVLEKMGVKDTAMGDIYANYGEMLSGKASEENLEKAWTIYRDCFSKSPKYCLFVMVKLLALFGKRGREEQDSEKYLPLAKEALQLVGEFGEEHLPVDLLTDLHGSCGDLYWDCGKRRAAEREYLLVEKYLLMQKEDGMASEKCIRQLKENAYRLRHIYINYKVKDSYTEEDLDTFIDEFTMVPKAFKKIIKFLQGEDKYRRLAVFFEKDGEKDWKKSKDFENADTSYQIAKVLYKQLEDAFPGKYKDKIKVLDDKIENLHSQWKDD